MNTRATLEILHSRLREHFAELRGARDQWGARLPVFALEHALSDAELLLLQATAREALGRGERPADSWLPMVVYATEIGYSYSGEEYWQTFESETPGWAQSGDRAYIRKTFQQFSEEFGGAIPSGSWAEWFSIIAWPITHAVLPKDLQRQLARLLFDYRYALTSEELGNPGELGRKLAARSWNTSSRFRNFAQNSQLLGQVALALLSGDDEESPYLLASTQKRITADLSAEREAGQWLRAAATTATRLRIRGLEQSGEPSKIATSTVRRERPTPVPSLSVQRTSDGWAVMIELPDLSSLAERIPAFGEQLSRLRCRIAGVDGPPLARGRLLFPGQRLRLDAWPDSGTPLVQFENGGKEVDRLSLSEFRLSAGPSWVFRLSDSSTGVEVRGKFVRPGQKYLLLSAGTLDPALMHGLGLRQEPCTTAGVAAVGFEVPATLSEVDVAQLRSIGVGVILDVEVRPVGLVPASWDGEGSADWIAGDRPLLAVRTQQRTCQLIVTVDGAAQMFPWPENDDQLCLSLDDLPVGEHELRFTLLPESAGPPIAEGRFTATILSPRSSTGAGTMRDALVILPAPATPWLSEVWDGRATLDVLGPSGETVEASVALFGGSTDRILEERRFSLTLPIHSSAWSTAFAREVRTNDRMGRSYDRAEACSISFRHPELGAARFRCEREFSPLRWAVADDRDGPFLQLIDHTGRAPSTVERRTFRTPAVAVSMPLATDGIVRWQDGGLLVATVNGFRVAAVLPPHVRNLADLQRANIRHAIDLGSRSVETVLEHITLAALWRSSPVPINPIAAHSRLGVLRAITASLASLIGLGYWARLERRVASYDESLQLIDFADAVGPPGYQRDLGRALVRLRKTFATLSFDEQAVLFEMALAECHADYAGGHARSSEFLFRLASEPGTLSQWPENELRSLVERALKYPVLVRAARAVVLCVHRRSSGDDGIHPYQGFTWE